MDSLSWGLRSFEPFPSVSLALPFKECDCDVDAVSCKMCSFLRSGERFESRAMAAMRVTSSSGFLPPDIIAAVVTNNSASQINTMMSFEWK